MNTTASLDQMQQLKMLGMYHAYHSPLELAMNQQQEGHELIAHLLGAEQLHRVNEKTTYYLKLAKLRLPATLEQIECSPARYQTEFIFRKYSVDLTCQFFYIVYLLLVYYLRK